MTALDLAEFLSDRWDEEERAARAIIGARDDPDDPDAQLVYRAQWTSPVSGLVEVSGIDSDLNLGDRRLAYHIAYWDPARVLADIAAKRAVLDYYEHGDSIVLHHVLEFLAQPYIPHPEFRDEWNPGWP